MKIAKVEGPCIKFPFTEKPRNEGMLMVFWDLEFPATQNTLPFVS
jgi:hypothetical protein